MNRPWCGAAAALLFCAAARGGTGLPPGAAPGGTETTPPAGAAAIDRSPRGEDEGAYTLRDGAILLEEPHSPTGLKPDRGVEEGPGAAPGGEGDVFIIGFGGGGAAEEDREVLRLHRELLESQLEMIRAARLLADRHLRLGRRAARIEGGARNVHAGMIASRQEIDPLRGEGAQMSVQTTLVAERTMRNAEALEEMSEALSECADAAEDLEMECHETRRGFRGD